MAWYDGLLEQGFVPAGTTPNVINAEGNMIGKVSTDPLSRLMRTLEASSIKNQAKQEKLQADQAKKMDIYRTLREQGYDPKKAYEAAMNGTLPMEAPGETMKDQTDAAGLEKTKAETEKIKKGINTKTKEDLENEILDKVSKGLALSPGEQKIYDDVIKRRKEEGSDSVDAIITGKNAAPAGTANMVPVYDPDGEPGFVPKEKLEAALAKGFTRR